MRLRFRFVYPESITMRKRLPALALTRPLTTMVQRLVLIEGVFLRGGVRTHVALIRLETGVQALMLLQAVFVLEFPSAVRELTREACSDACVCQQLVHGFETLSTARGGFAHELVRVIAYVTREP